MSEARSKTREEAKRETREALIRAGIEAFAAEGVDLPSLDAICARAGFTRGAFYVHFKDRDDFLLSVMDKVLSEFINSVIATGEYGEDLRKTVDLFISAAEHGLLPMVFGEINLRVLLEAGSRNPAIRERYGVRVLTGAAGLRTDRQQRHRRQDHPAIAGLRSQRRDGGRVAGD